MRMSALVLTYILGAALVIAFDHPWQFVPITSFVVGTALLAWADGKLERAMMLLPVGMCIGITVASEILLFAIGRA